jgi:hypothetical protein
LERRVGEAGGGGAWLVVFGRFVSLKKNVFEGQMVATDGGPAPGKARTDAGAFGTRTGNGFVPKKTKRNKSISDLRISDFEFGRGWFLRFWIF